MFKQSLCVVFVLVSVGIWGQIGSEVQPDAATDICDIPVYLDPDGTNNTSGYLVGETVSDFVLHDVEGYAYTLTDALADGPVLLVSGSYTCPRFRANLSHIEQIVSDFGEQLTPWIVYCVEAHPATDISPYFGYVNPATSNINLGILYDQPDVYQDRIDVVSDMLEELDVPVPVLLDTPCNDWWDAFGPAENNAYLIDTDQTVVLKHGWMNGFTLDLHDDLTTYFGGETDTTSYTGSFYITESVTESTAYTTQLLAAETDVVNDSEDPVQIQVVREILSATDGWDFSMCFGFCFSPEVDTIAFTLFGGYEAEFTLYTYPEGIAGESEVLLTFTNLNDSTNTFEWLVTSSSTYVGIGSYYEEVTWSWDGQELNWNSTTSSAKGLAVYDSAGRLLMQKTGASLLALPWKYSGIVVAVVEDENGVVYTRRFSRR